MDFFIMGECSGSGYVFLMIKPPSSLSSPREESPSSDFDSFFLVAPKMMSIESS